MGNKYKKSDINNQSDGVGCVCVFKLSSCNLKWVILL